MIRAVEYDWKPQGPDWDRLRELEAWLDRRGALGDLDEFPGLIERTFLGLGFSRAEADRYAASESGHARYVVDARDRIRNGSRRLGAALIAAEELAEEGRMEDAREQLRAVLSSEPVRFYRELAENELKGLGG